MSIKKKGYNITLGIFIGLIAGVIIGIIMPEWANMGIECGFHYLYVGIKNDEVYIPYYGIRVQRL